ncbi:UNVERIFIED_CONTAM: hypothetical protein Sradi_5723400 [Sesamum radiatum]|uniref:Uncharacterized protein n=1 Tax=Sesamum radiatum TaxID=300843 RepID=A0AAW2L5T8_SESRA
MDPMAAPPRRSTSSDTSTEELSPALLRAIQHVVAAALREHVLVAAPPRVAPPLEADAPDEEDEGEIPVPVPPAGRRRNVTLLGPQEVPPQWLACLEHLQKSPQDVKYQIEGAPEAKRQGVPFSETIMADELPLNCRTPAIAEYDGTADPMEHLSRFENAALLHRCINFRDLNKACPKDFYLLPRIDQLVDSTSGCELLSMMDASEGYHQIMLTPEDRKKVSFISS